MADTDWTGWKRFHDACGKSMQIIGDDLFTTNPKRIRQGIERGVANAVLIKLNQIGTVTETLDAIALTQGAGWNPGGQRPFRRDGGTPLSPTSP